MSIGNRPVSKKVIQAIVDYIGEDVVKFYVGKSIRDGKGHKNQDKKKKVQKVKEKALEITH